MIKFENTEVVGWEHAIRGMRNPMNSWEKSDSHHEPIFENVIFPDGTGYRTAQTGTSYIVGSNDHDLMMRLRNAGTDHRKFMRMIVVYVDIIAPLYWWKEFDTYKVGTVANSCSTMHKIHEKEFTIEDFSTEHLLDFSWNRLYGTIEQLNYCREKFINYDPEEEKIRHPAMQYEKKDYWWQMIQLLPSSYNQKRTVMLNYEVLANIYESRKNHKLDEWSIGFMEWIESLPYSELICGPEFLRKEFNVKKGEDSNDI